MKSFDDLLTNSNTKPRRPLRADFTRTIINKVSEQPRPRGWPAHIKELWQMKLSHKPILAAAAFVTLATLGTTAYATGGFGFLNAFFKAAHELPSGERVVQVETKDCAFVDAITVTKERGNGATYYYKVKKDSSLTNEQITSMVQGKCDLEKHAAETPNLAEELTRLNPANAHALVGGYIDSKVIAVSTDSLTIESAWPDGKTTQTTIQTHVIDPQVIVQSGSQRLTLDDVKPGDHISVTYRATGDALAHSETSAPGAHTDEKMVVAIYKNPQTVTDAIAYQKYNQHEFERVEPCDKSKNSSGYCSLAEYYKR